MKLSIIIPAHNEEKRISKTLEAYCSFFLEKKKEKEIDNFQILVVINNTSDKTEDIVKSNMKRFKNLSYIRFKEGGKGFAVIKGFQDAIKNNFDLIGFVDADMATPPEAFYYLIKKINGYDGAIASRYVKGSAVHPKPQLKRIISARIFNNFIKFLLHLRYKDTQCGAKIFKKNALNKVLPYLGMSKWAFDVDLLYALKKQKFKIIELPTKWSDREYSKINFMKAGPWMALAIVRLRLINSPLRFIIGTYDKILNCMRKFVK